MANTPIQIVTDLPKKNVSGDISLLLGNESGFESNYQLPLKILIKELKGTGDRASVSDGVQRVYVDGSERIENTDRLIDRMRALLPSFCNCLSEGFAESCFQLVYVANISAYDATILYFLESLDIGKLTDYFISDIQKITNVKQEHARLSFAWPQNKNISDLSFSCLGNSCFPGDLIIVGLLLEKSVCPEVLKNVMRTDILNKAELEELLGREIVKAFWMCDTDFDRISIWHKEFSGESLLPMFNRVTSGK